jgi:thioredoxin reductase (NADPH)
MRGSDARGLRRGPARADVPRAQIARVALHGSRRVVAAGETTFEPGTADPGIHIVLSGTLEVVRPGAAGDDLVTVLGAGQFTGEVSSLSGRRTLVRGRMREAGEVLVLGEKVVQGGIPEEGPGGEETDHGLSANRIVLPSTL